MLLQLALDRMSKKNCYELIALTYDDIDLIEIGTSIIKEYGMEIIRDISSKYPNKIIVADMKTCDAGGYEAEQAFKAGADITTVMGFSSDLTIKDSQTVAKHYNKRIMIDLLEITSEKRIEQLEAIGVDLVSLHIGKDKQKSTTFNEKSFSFIHQFNFNFSVAGGINLNSLASVTMMNPYIIIVGSAITDNPNPQKIA